MMKYLLYIPLIFCVYNLSGQCDHCPEYVEKINQTRLRFTFKVDQTTFSNSVTLTFERGNDGQENQNTGIYTLTKHNSYQYDVVVLHSISVDYISLEFRRFGEEGCYLINNVSFKCPPDPTILGPCTTIIDQGGQPTVVFEPECNYQSPACDNILTFLRDEYDATNSLKHWIKNSSGLFRYGSVGIGIEKFVSQDYRLGVNGGIVTDNFLMECNGWCDFVFFDDYELMPLSAIADYVSQNRHLPGFPSSLDIKSSNGIDVKSILFEQQIKLEEAYLYVIELEKKIKHLKQQLNE